MVDDASGADRSGIAIDSQGNPHIVYLGNPSGGDIVEDIRYAHHDGDEWQLSIIGPARDSEVSIAIYDDIVHIAYVEGDELRYAKLSDDVWHIETVASFTGIRGASIAIDSSGLPHISFSYMNIDEVSLAIHDGTGWSVDNVFGAKSLLTGLAFDSEDNPHIVHRAGMNEVIHSRHDGEAWVSETVDSSGSNLTSHTGQGIAIGAGDLVSIAYVHADGPDHSDRHLRFASNDGIGWSIETVDTDTVSLGTPVSVAVKGGVHIFYGHHTQGNHRYAHHDGSAWMVEDVMSRGSTGTVLGSMAVDDQGWPHVSMLYREPGTRELWHGVHGDYYAPEFTTVPPDGQAARLYEYVPGFTEEDVEITDHMTNAPFLSWDGERFHGTPGNFDHGDYWIYIEALSVEGRLKSTQNETFSIETRWVKSEPAPFKIINQSIAQRAHLAIDDEGAPHVTYSNYEGQLIYSRWDGNAWTEVLLNESADALRNVIVLDEDGDPHVLFTSGDKAVYMHYDNGWSEPEVVADDITSPIHLELRADGAPVTSFQIGTDVYFAFREGGEWHLDMVEEGSNSKVETMALDGDGAPHLMTVFSDGEVWELRHHQKDMSTGDWSHTVVQDRPGGSGGIGHFASLVFCPLGKGHAIYAGSGPSYRLWYSVYDEGQWTNEIFEDEYNYRHPDIAVDKDGNPHVSYFNGFYARLQYGVLENGIWQKEIVDGIDEFAGQNPIIKVDGDGLPHIIYHHSQEKGYRYAYLERWAPVFLNEPEDARVGDSYEYRPEFDEESAITSAKTNAPFLEWDGEAFTGVPGETHTGEWWIDISAESVYGGLSSHQNTSFIIRGYHAPEITITHGPHSGQVGELYLYRMEANETVDWDVQTDAGFLYVSHGNTWLRLEGTPQPEDVGSYHVNISATSVEGLLTYYENFTLTIKPLWAPEFLSEAIGTARIGEEYSYQVLLNETEVEWHQLVTDAAFLTFSPGNATVWGTPAIGDEGKYHVNISVSSIEGKESSHQNYTLHVERGWPPEITSDPGPITLRVTEQLLYTATANVTVHWSYESDADFISFDPAEGTFDISPSQGDAGVYYLNISATESVGGGVSHLNLTVEALAAWVPGLDWSFDPGQEMLPFEETVIANESVEWTLESALPPWMQTEEMDDSIRFHGTPGVGDAGDHTVKLSARSVAGGLTTAHELTFTINPAWAAVFQTAPVEESYTGAEYQYIVEMDEPVVFQFWTDAPFLEWSDEYQVIHGTPSAEHAGEWRVNISATSVNGGLSSHQNYTLTVTEPSPPQIGPSPPDARETLPYQHSFTADENVTWWVHFNMAGEWSELYFDKEYRIIGDIGIGHAGVYTIEITATSHETGLETSELFTLRILPVWAPQFTNSPTPYVPGEAYSFTPGFNESVTVTEADTNAPFLSWDEGSGSFIGTPGDEHDGSYWIKVVAVSDDGLLESEETWEISRPGEGGDDGDGDEVCAAPLALGLLMLGGVALAKRLNRQPYA